MLVVEEEELLIDLRIQLKQEYLLVVLVVVVTVVVLVLLLQMVSLDHLV